MKPFAPAVCIVTIGLCGCASEVFPPDAAPEFEVTRDYAPLFRFGPMQATPPDERLRTGQRVALVRREFGYSLVRLDDSRTGYMANEHLVPAEPLPEPPAPSLRDASSRPRSNPGPSYDGPVFDDVALPEPDLQMNLEDAPADWIEPVE